MLRTDIQTLSSLRNNKFIWSLIVLSLSLFLYRNKRVDPKKKAKFTESSTTNWFGNQTWTPSKTERPSSLEELVQIIKLNKGNKVRAVGSLHSWSRCAAIEGGVMIRMDNLNKVLQIVSSGDRLSVTAEAGIELIHLYEILRQHNLALSTLPNDGEFLLGGSVANGVHGTNTNFGTFCSLVEEITLVTAAGEVLVVNRDNPETLNLFETIVVSVGNAGVIYSVKLTAVPYYNCFVSFSHKKYDEMLNCIEELLGNGGSNMVLVFPKPTDFVFVKSQVPIHRHASHPKPRTAILDLAAELYLFRTGPLYSSSWGLMKLVSYLLGGTFGFRLLATYLPTSVSPWYDGEIIVRKWKSRSFLSLEYALPLEKVRELIIEIDKIFITYGVHKRICLRPVAEDTYGYLSPTKGRKSVYFDLQYSYDPVELKIYEEVEKLFIMNGGRASWSRKFSSEGKEVTKNYPEVEKYVQTIQLLDPERMFTNDFSMSMFNI